MRPTIQVKGAKSLQRKLDRLAKSGASRAMRKAARAGATVLLRAVRDNVPVREGLLKKAQDLKVISRRSSITSIVGANVARLKEQSDASGTTHAGTVRKIVNAATGQKAEPRRPTNIDHLVEFGHVAPDGQKIPPNGYMRRAADAAMPQAERVYTAKLAAEINAEAAK